MFHTGFVRLTIMCLFIALALLAFDAVATSTVQVDGVRLSMYARPPPVDVGRPRGELHFYSDEAKRDFERFSVDDRYGRPRSGGREDTNT